MVRGIFMAVTAVIFTYQWADMTSTALGLGIDAAKFVQHAVYRLCSRAFMGLPCPMNAAGISSDIVTSLWLLSVVALF
jgi:hypothetical protein